MEQFKIILETGVKTEIYSENGTLVIRVINPDYFKCIDDYNCGIEKEPDFDGEDCDDCPYCCPNCGECVCENFEDEDDENG